MNQYEQIKCVVGTCLAANILPRVILSEEVKVRVVDGRPESPNATKLNQVLTAISVGGNIEYVLRGIKDRLGEDDFNRLLSGRCRLEKIVEGQEVVAPVIELHATTAEKPPRKRSSSQGVMALRKLSANMM